MKHFCIYFDENKQELIGTDCYLPYDGRFKVNTATFYIMSHPHTKFVYNHQNARYIRLAAGRLINPVFITGFIKINYI